MQTKINNKIRTVVVLKLCTLTSASVSIPFVTFSALAAVAAWRVGTNSVYMAGWFRTAALVDIHTFKSIEMYISGVALA